MQNIPRILIKSNDINNNRFKINDLSQIKKIRQVLRMKEGDKVILFDGFENEYDCELEILSKEFITGNVLNKRVIGENPRFSIILAQGLPKAGKLEDVVRMCTEVGVNGFIFFESEYSLPKIKDYKESKIERLQKIIHEASRQSERSKVPQILELVTFNELISRNNLTKVLLSTHKEFSAIDFGLLKSNFINQKINELIIIVGPEGGFSPKELLTANENGVFISKMNLPILRTGTAGVVACGFMLI